MPLSAEILLAKRRGAEFYKSGNYSKSIDEYSIAIEKGDINDDELHLYYRSSQHYVFNSMLMRS